MNRNGLLHNKGCAMLPNQARSGANRILFLGFMTAMLIGGTITVSAQGDSSTCPAYIETVLDSVSAACAGISRNQVCYGNNSIEAQWNSSIDFAAPGDRASVIALRRLVTAPLQPDAGTWGVAMLALQANLPDATPGQNVTFIVFGDAEVTPERSVPGYDAPMQVFRLSTGITGIACQDVAQSGMIVQAPEATTVNFRINDVEVKVGSSALFQIDGDDLTVDTIEGFIEVTADGATEVAGEGVSVRVPRGGRPLRAALTRLSRASNVPWRLLPRQVRAMPSIPEGQIVSLNDCFHPSAQRAARNPIAVRAGEPIVLRLTIPHSALELARAIQRRTRNALFIDGQTMPPLTRVGPWRGIGEEFGGALGIEVYWALPARESGTVRVRLDMRTLDGQPIMTGVDGPDRDRLPEIILPQRSTFCALQIGGV